MRAMLGAWDARVVVKSTAVIMPAEPAVHLQWFGECWASLSWLARNVLCRALRVDNVRKRRGAPNKDKDRWPWRVFCSCVTPCHGQRSLPCQRSYVRTMHQLLAVGDVILN